VVLRHFYFCPSRALFLCSLCRKLFQSTGAVLLHMLAEHKCQADILRVTTTLPCKPTKSMPRKQTGAHAQKILLNPIGESKQPVAHAQKCPETIQSSAHAQKIVGDAHAQITLLTKTVQKNPRPITLDPALFVCSAKDCQFAGWTSIALSNHQQKMHSVRRFSCWPCRRNFRSDALLQAHVKRSHPFESPDPPQKPKPRCPDRRVRCPKPGCGLSAAPAHKIHKCRQTWACKKCGKRVCSAISLKNHMMSHTGVYMFKCAICGAGCSNYKRYTMHLETHNKHGTYKCTECDYTSKSAAALWIHKKRHHRPEAAVLPVQIKIEEVHFE
jgi:hypothetical protein